MLEWLLWQFEEGLDNFIYSQTGARANALLNDTDVEADQAQVMEEIETYEIRFLPI